MQAVAEARRLYQPYLCFYPFMTQTLSIVLFLLPEAFSFLANQCPMPNLVELCDHTVKLNPASPDSSEAWCSADQGNLQKVFCLWIHKVDMNPKGLKPALWKKKKG